MDPILSNVFISVIFFIFQAKKQLLEGLEFLGSANEDLPRSNYSID